MTKTLADRLYALLDLSLEEILEIDPRQAYNIYMIVRLAGDVDMLRWMETEASELFEERRREYVFGTELLPQTSWQAVLAKHLWVMDWWELGDL